MKNLTIVAMVVCAAVVSAAAVLTRTGKSEQTAANSSATSAPAPGWELQSVDGKTVRSSDFHGKVVVLDFWATWCPPCRAEIPGFIELQKQYEKQGLVVIGVSLDQGGAETVKAFARKFEVNYPIVLANEKVVSDFGGVEAIPTTFVIDQQGRIVSKHIGLSSKDEFVKEIQPLLKQ